MARAIFHCGSPGQLVCSGWPGHGTCRGSQEKSRIRWGHQRAGEVNHGARREGERGGGAWGEGGIWGVLVGAAKAVARQRCDRASLLLSPTPLARRPRRKPAAAPIEGSIRVADRCGGRGGACQPSRGLQVPSSPAQLLLHPGTALRVPALPRHHRPLPFAAPSQRSGNWPSRPPS